MSKRKRFDFLSEYLSNPEENVARIRGHFDNIPERKLETCDLKLDRPFMLQHDKELADLCLCFSALCKVTFLSDEIEYRTDNI